MTRATLLLATFVAVACTARSHYIVGTKAADTEENHKIIDTVEAYRLAMEKRDVPAAKVLADRFARAQEIRYSLRYGRIRHQGDRAFVGVLIDASYSIQTARGLIRQDMRDENEFVLAWDGQRWLFLSGM